MVPDPVLSCDIVVAADHHMVYARRFEGQQKATGNPEACSLTIHPAASLRFSRICLFILGIFPK